MLRIINFYHFGYFSISGKRCDNSALKLISRTILVSLLGVLFFAEKSIATSFEKGVESRLINDTGLLVHVVLDDIYYSDFIPSRPGNEEGGAIDELNLNESGHIPIMYNFRIVDSHPFEPRGGLITIDSGRGISGDKSFLDKMAHSQVSVDVAINSNMRFYSDNTIPLLEKGEYVMFMSADNSMSYELVAGENSILKVSEDGSLKTLGGRPVVGIGKKSLLLSKMTANLSSVQDNLLISSEGGEDTIRYFSGVEPVYSVDRGMLASDMVKYFRNNFFKE